MKRIISLSLFIAILLISLASCEEYCTCTTFAPHEPDNTEEYLLEKGATCSDFEVTPDAEAGIRCQ